MNELCSALKAELVQVIGNTALLLRRSTKPNPKLSNLIRAAQA
jgi:RNA-binding protein